MDQIFGDGEAYRENKKLEKAGLFAKKAAVNALKFTFNVLFAYVFQIVFGADNILPGVAICVGLTMLPDMDLNIRPSAMIGTILTLYIGAGLAAQFAGAAPWIAFWVYALFTVLILLMSGEPVEKKTAISFLLCFVFCQANPVSTDRLPARLAALAAGAAIVALVTALQWKRKKVGRNGRTLAEQIQLCARRRGYILRSAFGIAAAMTIGMIFGLKRPMWISIVVMSLTQVDFEATKARIKYRSMATVLGAAVFAGIMIALIPKEYYMAFILLLGYISFFTSEYKYTQIVNAVCALNASLFVLNPEEAIVTRIFCLAVGIAIVIGMWKLQSVVQTVPVISKAVRLPGCEGNEI